MQSKLSKITIGTRQSKLALAQTDLVINAIKQIDSGIELIIKPISTKGDRLTDGALRDVYGEEGKSAFTLELHEKLIEGEFDIIIHSMKDVAGNYSNEQTIFAAYLERASAFDCLITKSQNHKTIADLPKGSVVGTVSLRRKAAILKNNPDVTVHNLRGNVQTRITKLKAEAPFEHEKFDAIIMAEAAIERSGANLDLTNLYVNPIAPQDMLPAACQGIIGVECRKQDASIIELIAKITHSETHIIAECERAFLKNIEGNCFSSIGCLVELDGETLNLHANISSEDGIYLFSIEQSDNKLNYTKLGQEAAANLKQKVIAEKGKKFLHSVLNVA